MRDDTLSITLVIVSLFLIFLFLMFVGKGDETDESSSSFFLGSLSGSGSESSSYDLLSDSEVMEIFASSEKSSYLFEHDFQLIEPLHIVGNEEIKKMPSAYAGLKGPIYSMRIDSEKYGDMFLILYEEDEVKVQFISSMSFS